MTFQIGDKVVYPNQGVGTIENISTRSFGSAFERFYLLRFGCNSMTVLVPFSNAANIGLRRVTKDREIARVLSYLSNGACICSSDWKVRFKENTVKMQSGDLLRRTRRRQRHEEPGVRADGPGRRWDGRCCGARHGARDSSDRTDGQGRQGDSCRRCPPQSAAGEVKAHT